MHCSICHFCIKGCIFWRNISINKTFPLKVTVIATIPTYTWYNGINMDAGDCSSFSYIIFVSLLFCFQRSFLIFRRLRCVPTKNKCYKKNLHYMWDIHRPWWLCIKRYFSIVASIFSHVIDRGSDNCSFFYIKPLFARNSGDHSVLLYKTWDSSDCSVFLYSIYLSPIM